MTQYQRRHVARRRVLKSGTIEFGAKNLNSLPCTIRDYNEGGARIRVDSPMWFPDAFLLSSDAGERRPCRVVWRDGRTLGVAFTDPKEQEDAVA